MTTISAPFTDRSEYGASNAPLVRFIDRWIYVIMAALFVVIVLVGFVPDSLHKIALVKAGRRPPFPPIMHVHAVLMGAYLLLLLTQTILAATGRQQYHRSLGLAAFALVPALVIAGFILVPTIYHSVVGTLRAAPPAEQADLRQVISMLDNIRLLQIRTGLLFPFFVAIGLSARRSNPGLHKRLMILSVTPALWAAFGRMHWLPTTTPSQIPLGEDLYVLMAAMPLFAWDLFRTRRIHKAYLIWLAGFVLLSVPVYLLWDSDWWHAFVSRLAGA
jgi:lysylphosphatidylglycerol synthetase-like protein (DUF2156 family)